MLYDKERRYVFELTRFIPCRDDTLDVCTRGLLLAVQRCANQPAKRERVNACLGFICRIGVQVYILERIAAVKASVYTAIRSFLHLTLWVDIYGKLALASCSSQGIQDMRSSRAWALGKHVSCSPARSASQREVTSHTRAKHRICPSDVPFLFWCALFRRSLP